MQPGEIRGESCQLSVIVPVRNHAQALEACLLAIRVSARDRPDLEILVVDAGSTDGSANVAQRAHCKVLAGGLWTAAQARNAGAAAARGEVLAFIDADVLIGPDWIDTVFKIFDPASGSDSDPAAAGAWPFPPADGTRVQETFDLLRPHADKPHTARWLDSSNFVVRRSAFEQVGGFDPTFETCEDADLSLRLRRQGHRLLYDPRLIATHLGDPQTLRGVFLAELWRGRDNLRATRQATQLQDMISGIQPVMGLAALATCLGPSQRMRKRALGFVASTMLLRALRMVLGRRPIPWHLLPSALGVAGAYELARALAIAIPVPYRVRRRGDRPS